MTASAARLLKLLLEITRSKTCIIKNIGVNMSRLIKKLNTPTVIKDPRQAARAAFNGVVKTWSASVVSTAVEGAFTGYLLEMVGV